MEPLRAFRYGLPASPTLSKRSTSFVSDDASTTSDFSSREAPLLPSVELKIFETPYIKNLGYYLSQLIEHCFIFYQEKLRKDADLLSAMSLIKSEAIVAVSLEEKLSVILKAYHDFTSTLNLFGSPDPLEEYKEQFFAEVELYKEGSELLCMKRLGYKLDPMYVCEFKNKLVDIFHPEPKLKADFVGLIQSKGINSECHPKTFRLLKTIFLQVQRLREEKSVSGIDKAKQILRAFFALGPCTYENDRVLFEEFKLALLKARDGVEIKAEDATPFTLIAFELSSPRLFGLGAKTTSLAKVIERAEALSN